MASDTMFSSLKHPKNYVKVKCKVNGHGDKAIVHGLGMECVENVDSVGVVSVDGNAQAGLQGGVEYGLVLPRLWLLTGYSQNRQLVIAVTIDGSADN